MMEANRLERSYTMDYKKLVQYLRRQLWGEALEPEHNSEPAPTVPVAEQSEADPIDRILDRCVRNVESLRGCGNLGVDTDEMPEGYGTFGYDVTNPIPTLGIPGSKEYLAALRTSQGHSLRWERLGCCSAPNIEYLIDIYEIIDAITGEHCGELHLCPYNKRTSGKSPRGLYLKSRPR